MTYLSYPVEMKSQRKPSKPATASHTSALWLRAARQASGLTQAEVARRLGVDQSQVARAESGRVELSAANLDRYLGACRYRLVAVPTIANTAADVALAVSIELRDGDTSGAFRAVIQLINDLDSVAPAVTTSLVATRPINVNAQYDALLAGAIEWKLNRLGLPVPSWVQQCPALDSPWWVYEPFTGDADVEKGTPPELRRRGVFVDEIDLISV